MNFELIYNVVTGPLVWVAFLVFICGSLYRLNGMISLVNKKEKFIWSYMSLKYSLISIAHWIIPFGTASWRMRPVLTIMTFSFHICLLILPLFLSAHVIMVNDAWGISWPTLSDGAADAMTIIVIIGGLFFLSRRLLQRDVRYLSSFSDYILIIIAVMPFISGFIADQQFGDYRFWLVLHILSGEIMLMAIPFTRLTHMIYAIFTRAYLASEFGKVRHAKDW